MDLLAFQHVAFDFNAEKLFCSSSLQHPPIVPTLSFPFRITRWLGVGCKSLILFPQTHEWKSSQILGYHKKLRCSAASKIIWFKVIYVFGGETLSKIKSFEPKHQQKRQTNQTSCFEPHWTDWMEKVFWKAQALLDTHIVCAFKCFHSSISEEQSSMLIWQIFVNTCHERFRTGWQVNVTAEAPYAYEDYTRVINRCFRLTYIQRQLRNSRLLTFVCLFGNISRKISLFLRRKKMMKSALGRRWLIVNSREAQK